MNPYVNLKDRELRNVTYENKRIISFLCKCGYWYAGGNPPIKVRNKRPVCNFCYKEKYSSQK